MRLRRNSSKRSVDEVCQQTFLLGVRFPFAAIACLALATVLGLALAAVFRAAFAATLGFLVDCLHTVSFGGLIYPWVAALMTVCAFALLFYSVLPANFSHPFA